MKVRLSVIGLGKLGLCTAVCLADAGYRVTGVDKDVNYLDRIKSMNNFSEPHLGQMFERTKTNLRLTADIERAVLESDVSFIVVPTPSKTDGGFSNDDIEAVFKAMAPALKTKRTRHLINVVSTVMPESYALSFKPMIEQLTGKIVGQEIGYTYNPEFIALGSVIENFLNPDFVLVGESDEQSGHILEQIYQKTCRNAPCISRTSVVNAEIAKLSLNCFCTMKISFANQIAELCDNTHGANAGEICAIIGQDQRIGKRYFMPGLGFGGPCFPRDNEAFVRFSQTNRSGYGDLQRAVIAINDRQVKRGVQKITACAQTKGNTLALLGLAYKPGTPITERSQALAIARELSRNKQFVVRTYDPVAVAEEGINQMDSIEACVKGAHVAAILTPCPEFLTDDWHKFMASEGVVLDLWR